MDCTICVAKTKALISCAVTAQLICVFVFTNADCWFSGMSAHMSYLLVGLKIKRALAFGIGLTLLVIRISDILRGRAVD